MPEAFRDLTMTHLAATMRVMELGDLKESLVKADWLRSQPLTEPWADWPTRSAVTYLFNASL